MTYKVTNADGQTKCSGKFESPSESLVVVVFIFVHDLEDSIMEEIVRHAAEHAAWQAGSVMVQDLN